MYPIIERFPYYTSHGTQLRPFPLSGYLEAIDIHPPDRLHVKGAVVTFSKSVQKSDCV